MYSNAGKEHEEHEPFVFINAAMSADGKISTYERRQTRISGDADRELTEHLYGKSMKMSQKLASEAEHGAVEEEIRRKLVGTPLAVRGNVSKGEYGTALVVKEAWVPGGKLEEMAKRLGGAHV